MMKLKPNAHQVETPSPLMTDVQAAQRLGVSPGTLRIWRCTNRYPLPYVRLGERSIRYRPEDIEQFINSQIVTPAVAGL